MTDILETLFLAWGDPTPKGRATNTGATLGSDFHYTDRNIAKPVVNQDNPLAKIAQFTAKMPGQYFAGTTGGKIIRLIGFTKMGEPA